MLLLSKYEYLCQLSNKPRNIFLQTLQRVMPFHIHINVPNLLFYKSINPGPYKAALLNAWLILSLARGPSESELPRLPPGGQGVGDRLKPWLCLMKRNVII